VSSNENRLHVNDGPMPPGLRSIARWALMAFTWVTPSSIAVAQDTELTLLVQPLPREEMPAETLQPLADYLSILTGRPCTIRTPPNFPAYWEAVRHNRYDLAFDAPPFADYRIHKFGFTALAKTPDTASYSLVMREDARARDPSTLVGKRVATLGLTSIGTLRLNALFPNPYRQPVVVETPNSEEGLNLLLNGNVEAAFLPTTGISRLLALRGAVVILTTEPIPRLVLSASPRLSRDVTDKIRNNLLQANATDAGRAMLREIGIDFFDAATNEEFANQSYVLRGYWGY
jgi:ABC-type phosphate/phosphonate transport system substrate-binding protein